MGRACHTLACGGELGNHGSEEDICVLWGLEVDTGLDGLDNDHGYAYGWLMMWKEVGGGGACVLHI